jgi:hypothetical protein
MRKAIRAGVGSSASQRGVGANDEICFADGIRAGRAVAQNEAHKARQRCLTDPHRIPNKPASGRE